MSWWFDLQIQEVWSRVGQNRVWFDGGTALRQPEGNPPAPHQHLQLPSDLKRKILGISCPASSFLQPCFTRWLAHTLAWQKGRRGKGRERKLTSPARRVIGLLTFLTLLTLDDIGWHCVRWITLLHLLTLANFDYIATLLTWYRGLSGSLWICALSYKKVG